MSANVFDPEWDAEQDKPPFTWRRSRIGRRAACERLGASLLEVPPGSSYPPGGTPDEHAYDLVLSNDAPLDVLDGET